MNKKTNVNHQYFKVKTKYQFGLFLGAIISFLLLLLIIIILSNYVFLNNKINTFSYFEKSNLTYEVCLKENTHFEDKCLPSNREYIASIIDDININFNYVFNSSDKFDYEYSYYVETVVYASEKIKNKKVIYDKKEIILEPKKYEKVSSNAFIINEKISLDYIKYNEIMKEFKKEYAILFDSKVIVSLVLEMKGKKDNLEKEIINKQIMKLEIPLSEQTIDIAFNQNAINNNKVLSESIKPLHYSFYRDLLIIISFLEVLIFAILVIFIRMRIQRKNAYDIEINKIMKEYDRFITTVSNFPNIDDKEILLVDNFIELLDTKEVLGKPIIYHEVKRGHKGLFAIISDDLVYLYVLEK